MHTFFGRRLGSTLLVVAAAASAGQADAGAARINQQPLTLSVTATKQPIAPGGVALVTVAAGEDLAELTGDVSGVPIHFWPGRSRQEWHGLMGISLAAKAGVVAVELRASAASGATASDRLFLTVVPKRFQTRRLRVDPRLANPPADEAARIAEEAKMMTEAFAMVTPERLWRGRFEAPVPGTATSSFGRLTITNGEPSGRHQGADFRAAVGTPVRAPNAGRVVLAQDLYFAGGTVILDHGLGVFSLVAHLSRIDVAVGGLVARGDQLGESGATGRVTGPHLHWAVRFNETSVDPLGLMTAVAPLADESTPLAAQ